MSEVASTTASPLADSFQRCSRSFKELYLALFAYGPISLSKFNDEYGRFGVWGGDSGADRTGRGSLDDVLRNDPKTISIIAELLENLNDDLSICISLVGASTDPHVAQSHDGQEWLSDEESSVSSGSDASDYEAGSRVPSKTQRILHLLAIIVDHIQSLFQVSTLLRRPTISNKYLRSASRKTTTETESPFYPWDLDHIIEKMRFWINQQKRDVPAEKNEADDTQHQTTNYLCKRLATANVKRREQLDFWQVHPAQPSTIKLPEEPTDLNPVATTPNPTPTQQLPKKAGPRSEISKPSHGTKQSFSTVAKSDLNDSATVSGRPRTEYVSSTKGGKYVLRVPPVPKVIDGSPTFKCPYCSISLDANSMLQRELWKKHVFRDLRPYVCTFERCENPEKLYLTRHDWIYHETQMHRRQWICASCSQQKFSSRSDIKRHLLEEHAGQFPESQITIMVDICERPMDDDGDADCPICLATLSFSALRTHLATHLEELALFVLPCHMGDRSQDVGSDKVEGATRQRLASNASSSEDGLPPLDFEKSLADTSQSQDPEIFSKLLQSTVEFEHTDVDDWFVTNDQTKHRDNGDSILLAIAKAFRLENRWDEADELEAQVTEIRNTKLRGDHPNMRARMARISGWSPPSQEALMQGLEQEALMIALEQLAGQQGQPRPPPFSLTEDRVAKLPPDLRKQYIQSRQQFRQVNPQVIPPPMPEDMARFQSIKREERLKFNAPDHLPMDQSTRQAVANRLVDMALKLSNVYSVAPRWFTITHDEDRLRFFFRIQLQVAEQFEDQLMQTPKQSFSMELKDIDEALNFAQGMIADVSVKYPNLPRSHGYEGLAASQARVASTRPHPRYNINFINAKDTVTEYFPSTGLSKEFQVVDSSEFKEGRVFRILLTRSRLVPRMSISDRYSDSDYSDIVDAEYNQQVSTSIRRFVVLNSREGHSFCLPILTYGKRGTTKPGVEPAHHAIIFTESKSASPPRSITQPPSEAVGERRLPNAPVCVDLIDPRHQLDVMSRLNYAKIYRIDNDIKVCFLGKIHKASMKELEAAFTRVQDGFKTKEEEEGVHPDNRRFGY